MHQKITDYLEEYYPDDLDKILLADGFEEAFMGVVESFGTAPKACYNYDACINILMAESRQDEAKAHRPREVGVDSHFYSRKVRGMTDDEAEEYLEFNVTQAYVGENTPAFIRGANKNHRLFA